MIQRIKRNKENTTSNQNSIDAVLEKWIFKNFRLFNYDVICKDDDILELVAGETSFRK